MSAEKPRVKRAFLSCSNKQGLDVFARQLAGFGFDLLASGGTTSFLRAAGISVRSVEEEFSSPPLLGGLVKTLHPYIHAGILARRDRTEEMSELERLGISPIDIVVVDLYPFASLPDPETIDIGGVSLLRAAAKNHDFVTVVSSRQDYAHVSEALRLHHGVVPLSLRRRLAVRAFACTAQTDARIANWLSGCNKRCAEMLVFCATKHRDARYGENPEQAAAFYHLSEEGAGTFPEQLSGPSLSYNNLIDAETAFSLTQEFSSPAFAIVKHASPCGVCESGVLRGAWLGAWNCDSESAFGGAVACNRELDSATAEEIRSVFVETIVAPAYTKEALLSLRQKKRLRVLSWPVSCFRPASLLLRSVAGGLAVQEADSTPIQTRSFHVATKRSTSRQEEADLLRALRIVRYQRSNAIAIVRDGASIGLGSGQSSRVEALRQALRRAALANISPRRGVLASDGFFPFADAVEIAAQAGMTAIVQPGGSRRDSEVIAAANAADIAMVFTGRRFFRH